MTSINTGEERGWRDRAACRGLDPELFFPLDDAAPAFAEQIRVAKAVCATCPVRQVCLDDAMVRMPYGIAGGLTATERTHSRKGRHTAPESAVPEPAGLSRAEVRNAGISALRAGHGIDAVSAGCRVSRRTVQRWAAAATDQTTSQITGEIPAQKTGEGSAAATAAPLVSRSKALLRTPITEDGRV